MTNTIKKTYHWKILTEDGLLKEHKGLGRSYDPERLNGWDMSGYESEEEAQTGLLGLHEKYPYEASRNLVLVTIHTVLDEDWV